MAEDSDGSDEWGMEELNLPAPKEKISHVEEEEEYWRATAKSQPLDIEATTKNNADKDPAPANKNGDDDRPMILVDMTQLTGEQIHNKFDRNSVNDVEAASTLRKKLEKEYAKYAKDATLLGDGTVIPCGMSVWRGALTRLRDERPGHYFAPIFPPNE
jgi:hypothetical protein